MTARNFLLAGGGCKGVALSAYAFDVTFSSFGENRLGGKAVLNGESTFHDASGDLAILDVSVSFLL